MLIRNSPIFLLICLFFAYIAPESGNGEMDSNGNFLKEILPQTPEFGTLYFFRALSATLEIWQIRDL